MVMVEPVEAAPDLLDEAIDQIERIEGALSRFRPVSELSLLNESGGGRLTPLMQAVVEDALVLAEATGGLFDPTVLTAIEAAGYDRDFREVVERGPVARRSSAMGRWRDVNLDGDLLSLPGGVGLDLGGIGKGWAADAVARSIGARAGVCVDIGGDCAVVGPGPAEGLWPIGVDHDGENLVTLSLAEGGVSTSTTSYHRWAMEGGDMHHIIDPKTGLPARTDLSTVTVTLSSAATAEVWAKSVLVAGLMRGLMTASDIGLDVLVTGGLGGRYFTGEVFAEVPGVHRFAVDAIDVAS